MWIYAAYQGDKFLIVDTLDNVAKFLGRTKSHVQWMSSPSAQKRIDGYKGDNAIFVFKFKE